MNSEDLVEALKKVAKFKQVNDLLKLIKKKEEIKKNDRTARFYLLREFHLQVWAKMKDEFDDMDYGPLIKGWNQTIDDLLEDDALHEDTADLLYIDPGNKSY